MMMRTWLAASLLLLVPLGAAAGDADEEEWIPLFNGENLDGWVPKITGFEVGVNHNDTFRVENGILKVSYDKYEGDFNGRFGHLFTEKLYSYYRIRVEYRFVGEQAPGGPDWAFRNSGIMVHGQPVETMEKDQDFPICIEVQLLGGGGEGERSTANLCTPGTNVVFEGRLDTRHCINSTSKTFHGDQWVVAEAIVHGPSVIRHLVNGEEVLSYELPQMGGGNVAHYDPAVWNDGELLEEGSISLQSESHPVEFRRVELLPLVGCTDPKAKNYKSYYVKPDLDSCQYD
jgi:hypothetical protein